MTTRTQPVWWKRLGALLGVGAMLGVGLSTAAPITEAQAATGNNPYSTATITKTYNGTGFVDAGAQSQLAATFPLMQFGPGGEVEIDELDYTQTSCQGGQVQAPTFVTPQDVQGITFASEGVPVPGFSTTFTVTANAGYTLETLEETSWNLSEDRQSAEQEVLWDEPDCSEVSQQDAFVNTKARANNSAATGASWTVSKTADPASGTKVKPGDEITYTLTAQNTGDRVIKDGGISDYVGYITPYTELVTLPTVQEGDSLGYIGDSTNWYEVEGFPTAEEWSDTGSFDWKFTDLAREETRTISFTVKVSENAALPERLDNGIAAWSNNVRPDDCNIDDSGELVGSGACWASHRTTDQAWEVSKTADPASGTTVNPGDEITYTLTAKNTGDRVIEDGTISDLVRDIVPYTELVTSPTVQEGDSLVYIGDSTNWEEKPGFPTTEEWSDTNFFGWNFTNLAPEETRTISFIVKVSGADLPERLDNSIEAWSDSSVSPGCYYDCWTSHRTADQAASWTVSKTADPASGTKVKPGDEITYTLTAKNTGEATIKDGRISDYVSYITPYTELVTLPTVQEGDSLGYIGDSTNWYEVEGFPTAEQWTGTDSFFWAFTNLAREETRTISFTVKVSENANLPERLENRIEAWSDSGVLPDDCAPDYNSRSASTTSTQSSPCQTSHRTTDQAWTVSKTADPASGTTVKSGDEITYTLTAKNTGDETIGNGTIIDGVGSIVPYTELVAAPTLKAGDSLVYIGDSTNWEEKSGFPTTGEWTGTNSFGWGFTNLAPEETRTISFTVKVSENAALPERLDNSIRAGSDSVGPDDCALELTPNRSRPASTTRAQSSPCETSHPIANEWTVSKTADPASGTMVMPGDKITYTLTVANDMPYSLGDVYVTDYLESVSANTTLVSGPEWDSDKYPGWVDGSPGEWESAQYFAWYIGYIPAGETATLSYTVQVKDQPTDNQVGNFIDAHSRNYFYAPADCWDGVVAEPTPNRLLSRSIPPIPDAPCGVKHPIVVAAPQLPPLSLPVLGGMGITAFIIIGGISLGGAGFLAKRQGRHSS